MTAVSRSARWTGVAILLILPWTGPARGQSAPPGPRPPSTYIPPLPAANRPRVAAPYSPGVVRTQAPGDAAPPPPATGPAGPEVGAPASNPSETGTPRAENPVSGGESTEDTQQAKQEEEKEKEDPSRWLMKSLGIEDSPVKVYGWIQNTFTGNTNGRPPSGENFGVWPNHRANQWLGNQYYFILEKPLEQKDELTYGFRIDNLFGHDWQWTKAWGVFDHAFRPNHLGYDIPQAFGEVHLPILTDGGFDVRFGRWYSLVGYEVVPATARPLISVPYMFNYGQPFTHTGALTTFHVTDKINLYNAAISGWDRYFNASYRWGYMGGFSWTFNDDKTSLTVITVQGPNQFPLNFPGNSSFIPTGVGPGQIGNTNPNPLYTHSNRSLVTNVLSHKWTDKLTQVLESDQGHEDDVPGLQGRRSKDANWYSFGNWFLYSFNDKFTGVWRSEVFWDKQGARTGLADTYYEMTLGSIYKPKPWLWIRDEVRYDWAQFGKPYNDGTRGSQLTLGLDVIVLF